MFSFTPGIPDAYKTEFAERQADCIRRCVRVLCLAVGGLFVAALTFSFYVNPYTSAAKRWFFAGIMTLGCSAICLSTLSRHLGMVRLSGFLLTALVTFAFLEGPGNEPWTFAYAGFMLSMIAITLLVPWFFIDTLLIIACHFYGWFMYYGHRDLGLIFLPPTLFGTDPMVNGLSFLGLTALLCLIIRHNDYRLQVHNFLLLKDVEAKKAQMESELKLAARVHNTLLPQSFTNGRADVHVSYRPACLIGGDYAQFHLADEQRLTFLIGDVTGHGVPAALMVNRLHAEFDMLARTDREPGILLKKLNDFIVRDFQDTGMLLSAFCGTVNFSGRKILYSSYGHPPQFIYRLREGRIEGLSSHTTLLGIDTGEDAVHQSEIDYEEGDLLLLFTDGAIELRGKTGELYGEERLKQFLHEHLALGPAALHTTLMEELTAFSGDSFKDDLFVISVMPHAKAAATPRPTLYSQTLQKTETIAAARQ